MDFLLWLLALVLIGIGVVQLVQRDFLWGVIIIAVTLLLVAFATISPPL